MARAIQHGETETGVTVIRMTPRIDAGGMMAFARTPIDPDETAGELEARLAALGAPLVAEAIAALVAGTAEILPQDRSKVTKAPKLRKEDGRIDWTRSEPARSTTSSGPCSPGRSPRPTWHRPDGPARLIVHQTEPVEGQGTPGQVLEADGRPPGRRRRLGGRPAPDGPARRQEALPGRGVPPGASAPRRPPGTGRVTSNRP